MQPIPLPTGLRGDKNTPKQVEVLRNCYFETGDIGTIITRPVARKVAEGVGFCRGSGFFLDELYQVSNDRLIKITLIDPDALPTEDNILITDIGEIEGSANCVLRSSFTQLIIVVEGGVIYSFSDEGLRILVGTTDPISVPIPTSVSVAFNNGNFVFVPTTGDPFFWASDVDIFTDPGNFTMEFADAEEFTDLNKSVINLKKQLFVGGSRSFERFNFIASNNVYVSIDGSTSNYGYVGGLTNYADTFMYLGQGVSGGYSFFIMGNTAQPVSNKAVDEILDTYNQSDLEGIIGETFRWQSQDFAVFYLPNHTLAYYGDFALWHSGTKGNTQASWSISFMQLAYGYIWAADMKNNTISILTEDDEEYGKPIEGEIQTFVRGAPRSNILIRRIIIQCNPGINQSNQSVGMQVSRDSLSWGPMRYRELGVIGDTNKELSWGSPVIKSDHHVGIRFRWSGNIRMACDQVYFG